MNNKYYISALFLAILIAEIVSRALGFGYPLLYKTSVSGYEVSPNQHIVRLFKQINYNSLGLRNAEVPAQRVPGEIRIICIGDSITYGGTQVNDSETYPTLLETRFKREGKNAKILNASAAGWSPLNEIRWVQEHGIYDSQTVILELGENDLFQQFSSSSVLDNNVSFPSKRPVFGLSEIIFRYILPKFGAAKWVDPGVSDGTMDENVALKVIKATGEIAQYAKSHNANFLILYIDPKVPSNDVRIIAARDALFKFAKGKSIKIVRPMKGLNTDKLYRDIVHPDARGNDVIAGSIYETYSQAR